jgi:hypothetical protein
VAAAAIGLSSLFAFAGLNPWLALPLLVLFAFLPKKARALTAGALILFALWYNAAMAAEQFVLLLSLLLGLYLLFKLYALSKVLMRKPVEITRLEEGMISAQTIVQRGKNVEILPQTGIKKLIKYFASYKFGEAMQLMQPKGKVIVSSSRAGGLTEAGIRELKKLASEKKIPNKLLVKESAPFVPAVLIAYIALNIVGDVIWLWVF